MSNLIYPLEKFQRFSSPEWVNDGILYEVNVRQYTKEGTFKAFESHLPRLKSMGVSILWLMPLFPIGKERRKGSLGSYYSISDYNEVNPEFGDKQDLCSLIKHAHSLGMRVILDWVANHTSRDNVWLDKDKNFYEWDNQLGEAKTPWDWTDTAKLNYSNNSMRREMINSLLYWTKNFDIDGFRFDMAMLVPDDFWYEALGEVKAVKNDVFFLAESEGEGFHKVGFNATYSWNLHHLMVDMVHGGKNAWDLVSLLKEEAIEYPKDAVRMRFTSNHDEDSHQGAAAEKFGPALFASVALTYVLPGLPLIYSGEETCNYNRLKFFDKDEIIWPESEHPIAKLYSELALLRKQNEALHTIDGGDLMTVSSSSSSSSLLSIKRKKNGKVVIALFNFSNNPIWTRFYDSDFDGEYNQVGSLNKAFLKNDSDFYIAPWGWFVYYK